MIKSNTTISTILKLWNTYLKSFLTKVTKIQDGGYQPFWFFFTKSSILNLSPSVIPLYQLYSGYAFHLCSHLYLKRSQQSKMVDGSHFENKPFYKIINFEPIIKCKTSKSVTVGIYNPFLQSFNHNGRSHKESKMADNGFLKNNLLNKSRYFCAYFKFNAFKSLNQV